MSERLSGSLVGKIPLTADAIYYEYQEFTYNLEAIGNFPIPEQRGIERFLPLLPISEIPPSLARGVGNTPITRLQNLT